MIKKVVSTFFVVFLLTGCATVGFNGSRSGNENQFIIEYDMFNGMDSQVLSINQGEQMAINIVTNAGEVEVEVKKDNEEAIYTGTHRSNMSFTLGIDKSGSYRCTVTGRKAKGSVSFIKEEIEKVCQPEIMMGYLWIKDKVVYIDEVEIITTEQQGRIEELGLTVANDLPNGYYIYNEVKEAIPFELTDDTMYKFTDIDLKFAQDNIDRTYETSKVQEFREASSYQDKHLEEQKIPYRIEVYQDKVISITEEFIFTQ
ncbi:MAG: hypothetical protein ACRC1P_02835 [Cellulosilyticaceae bacterium]